MIATTPSHRKQRDDWGTPRLSWPPATLIVLGTRLWFGTALDRPFKFLASLLNFTRAEVFKVWIGVEDLHFPNRAFILANQEKPIVWFPAIAKLKSPTDVMSKTVTVVKFPASHEWSVPIHKLLYSVSGNFPQNSLVCGTSGDCDSPTPTIVAGLFSTFGPPHWVENMVGLKCHIRTRSPLFVPDLRIGWHNRNDGGVCSPIEFGWQMPSILKVNEDASFAMRVFRPHDFCNNSIWLSDCYIGLLRNIQGLLREFIGLDKRLPLVASNGSVRNEGNESDQSYPKGFSPPKPLYLLSSSLGVIILGLGWWYLNYSDGPGGNIVFILANVAIPGGVILCLYGFNGLLIWSLRF